MNSLTFLTGKVYPDRSFTIGIVPQKKPRSQDKQYERAVRAQPETDYGALADWYEGTNTIAGEYCYLRDRPLFIKGLESSREKISAYGEKGITGYGRRVVKNSCILLTKYWKKTNLGFGTCTLPDMHPDTLKCVLANWGEITRRFFQKLSRLYKKLGKHFYYVGCTEIQPKRLETYKMPVPHLHFVYKARSRDWQSWTLDASIDYGFWNDAVNEVLVKHGFFPLMGEYGHTGSFKLERIKTSAAAYLGKYISKGVKEVERMQELGYNAFPKQWWFACMQTKKMFKDSIIRLHACEASHIFYGLEAMLHEGIVEWGKYVELEINGEYYKLGCVGTFSHDAYKCFSSA